MGDCLEAPVKKVKFGEIFDEQFPLYLYLGMTYEQFWEEDPSLVIAYRKAHKLKQRESNEMMWLQGVYTIHALQTVVGNAFLKKDAEPFRYPSEPLPITEKELREKEEKEARQRAELIKARMIQYAEKRRKDGAKHG